MSNVRSQGFAVGHVKSLVFGAQGFQWLDGGKLRWISVENLEIAGRVFGLKYDIMEKIHKI